MNEENAGSAVRRLVAGRVVAGFAVVVGIMALSLLTMRSSMASPSASDQVDPLSAVPVAFSDGSVSADHSAVSTIASVAAVGEPSPGAFSGEGTSRHSALAPASPAVLVADNQAGGAASAPASPAVLVADDQTGGTVSTSSPATPVGGASPAPVAAPHPTEEWTWSTFPVKFGLKFENVYDDNIYIRNSNRVGDFYWQMTPSLDYASRQIDPDLDALEEEPLNYLHLNYAPEFDRFLTQKQNNFIDQHANGEYMFTAGRLKLGLEGGYNTSHYANVDFGGRLNAGYYTSRAYWEYQLGGRTTVGGDVAMTLSRYKGGVDTDEYTTSAYADYLLFPKTKIGFGTTLGYLEVAQFQPHQDYGQFYARASYQIHEKISLTGKVGVEYREYNGPGDPTGTEPFFALGVEYEPFDSTTLQLQAARESVPSISQVGDNYYDSNVSLTWRQRILHKVYFALKGTYEYDDYYSVANTASTGLNYNYYTVSPSLEWDWNKYLTFNAYYQWQDNHSSIPFGGFYDNSVGVGAKFAY